jgi:hypothetical protein
MDEGYRDLRGAEVVKSYGGRIIRKYYETS